MRKIVVIVFTLMIGLPGSQLIAQDLAPVLVNPLPVQNNAGDVIAVTENAPENNIQELLAKLQSDRADSLIFVYPYDEAAKQDENKVSSMDLFLVLLQIVGRMGFEEPFVKSLAKTFVAATFNKDTDAGNTAVAEQFVTELSKKIQGKGILTKYELDNLEMVFNTFFVSLVNLGLTELNKTYRLPKDFVKTQIDKLRAAAVQAEQQRAFAAAQAERERQNAARAAADAAGQIQQDAIRQMRANALAGIGAAMRNAQAAAMKLTPEEIALFRSAVKTLSIPYLAGTDNSAVRDKRKKDLARLLPSEQFVDDNLPKDFSTEADAQKIIDLAVVVDNLVAPDYRTAGDGFKAGTMEALTTRIISVHAGLTPTPIDVQIAAYEAANPGAADPTGTGDTALTPEEIDLFKTAVKTYSVRYLVGTDEKKKDIARLLPSEQFVDDNLPKDFSTEADAQKILDLAVVVDNLLFPDSRTAEDGFKTGAMEALTTRITSVHAGLTPTPIDDQIAAYRAANPGAADPTGTVEPPVGPNAPPAVDPNAPPAVDPNAPATADPNAPAVDQGQAFKDQLAGLKQDTTVKLDDAIAQVKLREAIEAADDLKALQGVEQAEFKTGVASAIENAATLGVQKSKASDRVKDVLNYFKGLEIEVDDAGTKVKTKKYGDMGFAWFTAGIPMVGDYDTVEKATKRCVDILRDRDLKDDKKLIEILKYPHQYHSLYATVRTDDDKVTGQQLKKVYCGGIFGNRRVE